MQLELDLQPPRPPVEIRIFPCHRMTGAIREAVDDALASKTPQAVLRKEVMLWRLRLTRLQVPVAERERSVARFKTELFCELLRRQHRVAGSRRDGAA
ncbi:hypothetical protein [Aminobacter sp. Piv2-1]|uniref:hypothetical protein n=1 Tax=Aminobacter sp. Piv2-1 TaxID=3031122 RepID=UPI0030A3536D